MRQNIVLKRKSKYELYRAICEKESKGYECIKPIQRMVNDHYEHDLSFTYSVQMRKAV